MYTFTDKLGRELVYLTVTYSPIARGWFIETTYPGFITRAMFKMYTPVPGKYVVYMVKGFQTEAEAKEFAIDYDEAKSDGYISRLRLD